MMRKRLSKKIWYGSDVDSDGKPVLPPLAKDPEDLEGLHYGELYLHIADDKLSLWTRTLTDQIKQIGGEGSGGELWQLKETENGEKYIFSAFDVATQKGITMYANGGMLDLPSIYDGLPLDNKTIWFNPETKLIEVIGYSSEGDEGGFADFSNVMESGTGNAYTSFVLSEDGKGLTFVKGETFAKQSDYEALNNKVADFLEGSDTDEIINKWKELETFLSGMKEIDDLSDILSTKWTKDDAKIANWDTAFGWGDHSKAGYMKKEVIYDESIGCWKLVGDLLVTGGITMFANDGTYTPSTITDGVNIDNDTLIRVGGVIMVNPDVLTGGGGGGTDIDLSEYAKKATTLAGYGITDAYTKTQVDNLIVDYLPLSGGTMTGTIKSQIVRPKTSNMYSLGTSSYLWSNIYSKLATIDDIEIKKSASGVLFIDANLVVSGGITMYGTDGTTSPSIWDGAPIATTSVKGIASFDSNYFAVNNGKVTFIGSTGGGAADSVAWDDVTGKPSWIGSSKPSYAYSEITGTPTIPTNTNQLTNGAGFITSSASITGNAATATKVHVTSVANTGPFPIIYTDVAAIGSNGNRSLYCTSKSGAGYKPASDTFVASYFNGDVNGNINIGGDTSYRIETFTNGLELNTYSLFRIMQSGTTRLYMDANGNFGIKTSSPSSALHVAGSIFAENKVFVDDEITIQGGTSNPYIKMAHGSKNWYLQCYNSSYMYMGSATANSLRIDSSGNVLTPGGITMYSDERKKTILNNVELSLKEVADAPLIEHYYNSDEAKTTHVGSVAQYWRGLNDWFCKEDGEGFLTMEIQNAALASAISVARELTRYENKTDKQIKKLKKRIGELEEEIENLKNK